MTEEQQDEIVCPGPIDPTICPHHNELKRDVKALSREARESADGLFKAISDGDAVLTARLDTQRESIEELAHWANGDLVKGMKGAEERLQLSEQQMSAMKERLDGMEGQVVAIGKIADLDVESILDTINKGIEGTVPNVVRTSTTHMATDIQGKNQRFAALCALAAAVISTTVTGGFMLYAKKLETQALVHLREQQTSVVAPAIPGPAQPLSTIPGKE